MNTIYHGIFFRAKIFMILKIPVSVVVHFIYGFRHLNI